MSFGLGHALGGNGARFQLNCPASSTIESTISNGQHDDTQEFFKLEGLVLQGQFGVTVTKGLLFLKNIFVNSVVREVYTANCYATCLFLQGGGGLSECLLFDNDNFDSTGTSTGAVAYISGDSTGFVANINFIGGAIQHAGSGQSSPCISMAMQQQASLGCSFVECTSKLLPRQVMAFRYGTRVRLSSSPAM